MDQMKQDGCSNKDNERRACDDTAIEVELGSFPLDPVDSTSTWVTTFLHL